MNALKETSKALKQYGRTVDVASIDHLLNNLEDATDFAEDLNNEYDRDASIDMGAVEDELEAMLADESISTDLSVPAINTAPLPLSDAFLSCNNRSSSTSSQTPRKMNVPNC